LAINIKNMFFLLFTVLLQGCLGDQNAINKDVVFLQTVPVCETDEMCKKMWLAAESWVDKYSAQGVRTVTDKVIMSEEKDPGSDDMDIEIKKIKQENGSYKIIINNFCSRSLSSCDRERKNMIAFNKKLISFLPAEKRNKNKKLFDANKSVDQWVAQYTEAIGSADLMKMKALVHYPLTYVEKDKISVIFSDEDMREYLQRLKKQFSALNGVYLKASSFDVFGRTGANLYVNVVLSLHDAESVAVGAQQIGFQLIKVDKKWKMISAGTHIN